MMWAYILKSSTAAPTEPQKKLNFLQICPKMPRNGPKMAKNDPKWPKVAQIWPQMTQNGPRMIQNGPKMTQNGPKMIHALFPQFFLLKRRFRKLFNF